MKRKKVALVITIAVCAIMCGSNTVTFASGYTEENQDDYLIGNTNNPQRPGSYSETELTESELQHLRIYRNMPNTVQELLDSFLSEVFKGTI